MRPQLFAVNIRNNTNGAVPLELFNSFSGKSNVANATKEYRWNVTGVSFSPPSFTIQARPTPATSFQTLSGSCQNLSQLLIALNALNIGSFWTETSGPNTYVVTWNNDLVYGDLIIGMAASPTLVFNSTISNPGNVFALLLNGSGTISGSIDYGDGNIENFSQAGPVNFNHAYASAGNYVINVYLDNPANITLLTATNSQSGITAVSGFENMTGLIQLVIQNQPLSAVDISQATSLASVNLASCQLTALNVTTLMNLTSLILGNNLLTSIDVTQNVQLVTLLIQSNPIPSIDISQNIQLVTLGTTSTDLTILDLSTNTLITGLQAGFSNLTVSAVNAILVNLDNFGLLNGSISLQGQTPAAAPTGAGATAKLNLQGKGWTVLTD